MDRLIKKANYFDYSIGEIRKCVNQGEGYDYFKRKILN
jgi:hypothetical protein